MLTKILEFLKFSNQFRTTYRAIYAVGEDRNENDVEHSFQLAIFAWYLIDTLKIKLDSNLAIKYALIHDLDETFDGDKHIFDIVGRVEKEKNARQARKRIMSMFPGWSGYTSLAENYKNLVDTEARFVYCLDKILPVLNIVLDQGRSWHREDTTLAMLVANKREKVSAHPVTQKLWNELEKYLHNHEMKLFGKK
jgi:putative hydrolase of HD superfamily